MPSRIARPVRPRDIFGLLSSMNREAREEAARLDAHRQLIVARALASIAATKPREEPLQ